MLRIRNYLSIIEFLKRGSKRFSVNNFKDKPKSPQEDKSFMLNHSQLFINETLKENFKPLDQKTNPSLSDNNDYNITFPDKHLFTPDNLNLIEKDELYLDDKIQEDFKVNESNFKSKIQLI